MTDVSALQEWGPIVRGGLIPLGAGLVLGLVYFAGLWWTSKRVARVASPKLFFFGSFALRMAVLLAGIWFVTKGHPVGTALAMAGLLVGRKLVFLWVDAVGGAASGRDVPGDR